MRLLKTAVFLFLTFISLDTFAATSTEIAYRWGNDQTDYKSRKEACDAWRSSRGLSLSEGKIEDSGEVGGYCVGYRNLGQPNAVRLTETWQQVNVPKKCPASGYPVPVWIPAGSTHVPIKLCKDGCTITGSGNVVGGNNFDMTPMSFTGNGDDCTDVYKDDPPPKCDSKNPYGDCYKPPNDNCIRLKDGSINCPTNDTPPPPNETCNGATYCNRPPQGCGEGYVPGSFNGQQLCVRSGPNKPKDPPEPDKPEDPNNCMNGGSYCPQPPNNTTCPDGYYETIYNGSKICVKNNPDPEKPNPNDPTGGKGPDGGDGGDNGGDGGDGSTGGSVNLKPVIDAINSLKNALLNALAGISGRIDQLVNGQKQTNEKLDKSNEHLDNIEDSTQAASEGIGETNKKLDGIKDAVDGIGKCKNPSYDPTNLNSVKYFDCTANELGLSDTPFQIKQEQITDFQREDHIKFGTYCPYSKTVEDIGYFKFEKDLTFICEFGNEANPYIRAIGYLGALIYLLIALRSRD